MIGRAAAVVLLLLLYLPAGPVPPAGDLEDAAQAAAESWLKLVDAAQYAESWAQAAVMLRQTVRPSDWETIVGGERSRLGRVVSRKLKSRRYTEKLLGAPAGKYVILEYDSVFEHRAAAVETVVPMLESDGFWRVFGVFLR
jgi:hypothetical protein